MRYANIYICFFVLHLGFFQQPRPRVGILVGRRLLNAIQRIEIQTFNLRKLTMFVYANSL